MLKEEKVLLQRLAIVAIPVMIQNLVQSGVGFLDTLMIGQLGETEVAAVGGANQYFFFIQIAFFGLNSGSSIFLAQFYGAKNTKGMRKVLSLASSLAILMGALGGIIVTAFPSFLMKLFSSDPQVIWAGSVYLRAVGVSYLFSGFSSVYSGAFRATGDARTPMVTTTISLFTNALLNYILIFGPGPFPSLGILGGAIATVISRILEAFLLIVISLSRKEQFIPKEREDFRWEKSFIRDIAKTGLPAFIHETLWVIGSILYKVAYSRLGTGTFAATNICLSIQDLFFVAGLGLAGGAGVVLGNTIGKGEMKKAQEWGEKIILLSLLTGIAMGILEFILGPLLLNFYNISPEVLSTARKGIFALSFILPLELLGVVIMVGILRSGGDSKFSMLSEIIPMYLISIPLTFLGASIFRLPLWALMLVKLSETVTKALVGALRIRSGKWIINLNDKRN